jgi:formylmethanofuran dehydrogenase subunit C
MDTEVRLTLRTAPVLPVEAEALNPENVTGKERAEIESLPLLVGNRPERVGDHFDVDVSAGGAPADGTPGDGSLATLLLEGDLSRFKRLGERMVAGRMIVHGPVGFHAGAHMSGGSLTLLGDAGDYLGAHMHGGRIEVRGSAGHFAGAAYRGYTRGMSGGTIIIHGNAGQMVGARMRRGLVAVLGCCGDGPGFGMKAGTVLIGGPSGVRAGAVMVRGTVILMTRPPELLPTFRYNCSYRPPIWPLLFASLARADFRLPGIGPEAVFESYSGDLNEGGRGEILVCQARG